MTSAFRTPPPLMEPANCSAAIRTSAEVGSAPRGASAAVLTPDAAERDAAAEETAKAVAARAEAESRPSTSGRVARDSRACAGSDEATHGRRVGTRDVMAIALAASMPTNGGIVTRGNAAGSRTSSVTTFIPAAPASTMMRARPGARAVTIPVRVSTDAMVASALVNSTRCGARRPGGARSDQRRRTRSPRRKLFETSGATCSAEPRDALASAGRTRRSVRSAVRGVVGTAIVGAAIVDAAIVGAAIVGAAIDGAAIVGAAIVGAAIVGAAIVGIAADCADGDTAMRADGAGLTDAGTGATLFSDESGKIHKPIAAMNIANTPAPTIGTSERVRR